MPEKDEQKRGHKYPFIAGEIFNCEINPMLEKFFEAPEPAQEAASTTDQVAADDSAAAKDEDADDDVKFDDLGLKPVVVETSPEDEPEKSNEEEKSEEIKDEVAAESTENKSESDEADKVVS